MNSLSNYDFAIPILEVRSVACHVSHVTDRISLLSRGCHHPLVCHTPPVTPHILMLLYATYLPILYKHYLKLYFLNQYFSSVSLCRFDANLLPPLFSFTDKVDSTKEILACLYKFS